MSKLIWCLISFTFAMYTSEAYKILVVFPSPGKSHSILGSGVVNLLLNHGHEVTYITPFLDASPHPNLRQIDVSDNFGLLIPNDPALNLKSIMDGTAIPRQHKLLMINMNKVASSTLENENVRKLLQDPSEKFDVVIFEWMLSEILSGIAAVYDVPFIWLSTVEPYWMVLRLIDDHLNPAYNSDIRSNNFPPLNFVQRLEELWTQIKIMFFLYTYNDIAAENEYERLVAPIIRQQGRVPPEFNELKFNASLILGNSHVSLGQPTRLPQNYKPIAGYHIEEEVKSLPKNLQNIMDNAKAGVIYFSMGTKLKSKEMPEEIKNGLLKMFGQLKQTVLWKFEEKLPECPKNVHILDWAPQQSILAHPNCVLFITHGGLLSLTEAVHFGVPIIGVPIFGDQFINIERAIYKGFAKKVPLSFTMHEEMKVAIEEILENSSYAKKAKDLSLVYHHRPAAPSTELVHWVEHVIQTNGAPHLQSLALHVPWYQKIYLDLVVIIFASLIVIFIVGKLLFNAYFRKAKVKNEKKSN